MDPVQSQIHSAMSDERSSKLLIVFAVFLALFNYPLLEIVDKRQLWFGFPALYFYMFLVWAIMIYVIARIVRRQNKRS